MRLLALLCCLLFAAPAFAEVERRGIGITWGPNDDGITIQELVRGGPAEAAGLKPGDVVEEVDGQPARGMDADAVVARIAGPEGSTVRLTLKDEAGQVRLVTVRRTLPLPADPEQSQEADDTSWRWYRSVAGLSLQLPAGWIGNDFTEPGWTGIESETSDGLEIIVGPVVLETEIDRSAATAILNRLLAKVEQPAALSWSAADPLDGTSLRVTGRGEGVQAVAAFSWVAAPNGTAGLFIAVIDGDAQFSRDSEVVAQVLDTLHLSTGRAGLPVMRFETWRDPREGAFTLQVPEGWRIEGGLARFGADAYRPVISAVSSDGLISVFLGDIEIGPVGPLEAREQSDGPPLDQAHDLRNRSARLDQSGMGLARDYAVQTLAKGCNDVRFDDTPDLTPVNAWADFEFARYWIQGFHIRSDIGEARFTCDGGTGPLSGYVLVNLPQMTPLAGGPQTKMALSLDSYIAAADLDKTARAVLALMVDTFSYDTQWSRRQHSSGALSSMMAEIDERARVALVSGQIARDGTWQAAPYLTSPIRRGKVEAVGVGGDSDYVIETSDGYTWLREDGTVAGTDLRLWPSYDIRKLLALP